MVGVVALETLVIVLEFRSPKAGECWRPVFSLFSFAAGSALINRQAGVVELQDD